MFIYVCTQLGNVWAWILIRELLDQDLYKNLDLSHFKQEIGGYKQLNNEGLKELIFLANQCSSYKLANAWK